jgi:hypothetical protein
MDDHFEVIFLLTKQPGLELKTYFDDTIGDNEWRISVSRWLDSKVTYYKVISYRPVTEQYKTYTRLKFDLREA